MLSGVRGKQLQISLEFDGGWLLHTTHIKTGGHTITAADTLPDDLRTALNAIRTRPWGTSW
jgi:hypothetical protein